jgi:hypothetical protein
MNLETMKMLKSTIFFLIIGTLFSSCAKELDSESPKIEFIYPKQNADIVFGSDSLHIKIAMTDNVNVKNVQIKLLSPTNSPIYEKNYSPGMANYLFQDSFVPKGVSVGLLTLAIKVQDNQNETNKSITFTVRP